MSTMRHTTTLAITLALLTACESQPRWYKGNLHTHSLWSDGNHFPEMIVDWYASRDYDFLALTEHNIVADHDKWMANDLVVRRGGRKALADYRARFGEDWVEQEMRDGKLHVRLKKLDEIRELFDADEFLLIPAEEITAAFQKKPIHINATNVAHKIPAQKGTSVTDVMRKTLQAVAAHREENGQPVLVHVNHPNFGWGITPQELAEVTEEQFFEVYNGHPSVNHRGDKTRPSTERMWDIANTTRIRDLNAPVLYGMATDDCHNYHNASGSTPGRGWVMVRATELTAEALIEAMERGDFYASSGVFIDSIETTDRMLALEIAAQGDAQYVTEIYGTRRGSDEVGVLLASIPGLHPRYYFHGDELFVRATVTSTLPADNPVWQGQKRQAWIQPVVVDQKRASREAR